MTNKQQSDAEMAINLLEILRLSSVFSVGVRLDITPAQYYFIRKALEQIAEIKHLPALAEKEALGQSEDL